MVHCDIRLNCDAHAKKEQSIHTPHVQGSKERRADIPYCTQQKEYRHIVFGNFLANFHAIRSFIFSFRLIGLIAAIFASLVSTYFSLAFHWFCLLMILFFSPFCSLTFPCFCCACSSGIGVSCLLLFVL